MSDKNDFLLSSYDYELDSKLIAQYPVSPRHSARMMVVQESKEDLASSLDSSVWNLQHELRCGDLLVLNNTKVLKARLRVRLASNTIGELLLLEPYNQGKWLCLARPARRMRAGDNLWLEATGQESICLKVVSQEIETGGRIIQFPSNYFDRETIQELLEIFGEVPLPPYIERHDPNDEERYQTRYAACPGAVAAPTAGLHLSDELLNALERKGVVFTGVTLHVGLGTFRPIDKEDLTGLQLHSEWVEVKKEVVQAVYECRARGGRIIAVGTTSVRALEGAFAAGNGSLKPFNGLVDLVIKPGYKFGVIDGLLTNFHLPKSSLLLLVSALIGRQRLMTLYAEAIKRHYRFFSYGDAMWIKPEALLSEARLT